jgi:all-trans-retinol 13,14-reductase
LPDNQSVLRKYDAIVIGSGISGLTISLILAKEGYKVALFEKDQDIAPLIRPYKRKGYGCSPGLHISGWMDEGEAIDSFLDYLNVSDGVEKELFENGFGNVMVGSNIYRIPRGFDNVEKSLLSSFPDSSVAVSNYIRLVKKTNEESFYFNHQLTPDSMKHELMSLENYTLDEWLKKYDAPQELIDIFGTLNSILIGSRADEVPFKIHALVLGGFYRSLGFFTISGIYRMLSNFKRELEKSGVTLFCNSEVTEILTGEDKKTIGVKTANGYRYFSEKTIASFNPKLLNKTIQSDVVRPIYRKRLAEAENTSGLYVAFYKVKNLQIIGFENFAYYDRSLKITFGVTVNHSEEYKILSALLADDDKIIPTDNQARKILAEAKLKLLENIINDKMPSLKGQLVLLDYLKPWSFERYTKTVNGSAYGIKQTLKTIGFQHKTPIRGLYLVGQAIYPGFLGAMISSFGLACELFGTNEYWLKVINR